MVVEQLLANVDTNVKFFRRNRILLGATLLYLVLTGLMLIPAIVFVSSTKQFDILKMLHDSLSNTVMLFTAFMGLLYMSSHFRNRSVKMVLTKPCTPEVWLASLIVAAAGISLALNLVVAAISGILFAVWGLPFQGGLIFVTIDNYLSGLVVLGFVVFLATAMPPVLAVIVALIANESAFNWLRTVVTAGIDANGSAALTVLDKILYGVYMVLPSYSLFHHKSETAYSTWRVQPHDWLLLLHAAIYTCTIVALFYLLTLVMLKRKSLG